MMTAGYDLDPNAPATVALQSEYARRSEICADMPTAKLDLAYGPHPRNRLDVFTAGGHAPVLVFFHGGYWRAGSKESRRFPAAVWIARGVSWVTVGYRLVPEFTLRDAVSDARSAVGWLLENAGYVGLDSAQLHLAGNSAGAHLAAMAAADIDGIRSLILVSGLFDLEPLLDAAPNKWLRLDAATASELSPVHHQPSVELPLLVAWGSEESEAFKSQSKDFARKCRRAGNTVTVIECPARDHFGIIGDFGTPGTPLYREIERLLARTSTDSGHN